MQALVDFDPDAVAPLWLKCLERWLPDDEVRDFLQLVAGTCLSGHPVEKILVNLGGGANGKSKCWGAIKDTLGPYAVEAHKSLIVAQRYEQHPTVIASLFRARLVLTPETSANDKLNEESLKKLTGGDRLSGRKMREDLWEFNPTHTAIMHTNYRPGVKGTDEGIWRRLLLIPWSVEIPKAERDEHLAAKLAKEASGILNWMLEGCLIWQEFGLEAPESITKATQEYRQSEDHVSRFIAECIERNPQGSARSSNLRKRYEDWCDQEGEQPDTPRALGDKLNRAGFRSEKSGGQEVWRGLLLVGDGGGER